MPFFDKDKVKLELAVNNVVLPGASMKGVVKMKVIEDFKCTAVRFKLEGIEETKQVVRRNKSNHTITQTTTHFCQNITLTESQSGKGGLQLRAGDYSFNINIVFPPHLPPSFSTSSGNTSSALIYQVTVYVDIPNGFDAELICPIMVPSAVPRSLYDNCRVLPYNSGVMRCSVSKGCCGCCSSKDFGFVETTVICQRIACVPPSANGANVALPPLPPAIPPGMQPDFSPPFTASVSASNELMIRLLIHNASKEVSIESVDVRLLQVVDMVTKGRHSNSSWCVASATVGVPNGRIGPMEKSSMDLCLSINQPLSANLSDYNRNYPLPKVRTAMTTTSTVLVVSYPKVDLEEAIQLSDVILLSSVVDTSNQVSSNFMYMA